ncbi:MAG: hypothetical protein KGI40_02345 [Xanthomonadaceae bacterium]|nr:hypothetical protein [Xanthomonadaceae bacterium]MDE1957915.1 hypothetical protein [Xanthomonadaceae bacterium]MDE2178383.1 hypothetical protein [Xanthomonadaceae bacterium]MDE2244798.1 hypothetical protein [Xanthomonadaceae bacterium]
MAGRKWTAFPHPDKAYDYAGDRLARAWKTLHAGDLEPWPDSARITALLKQNPRLGRNAATLSAALQEAWRDYHRGDFQRAWESGVALGALGASVAVKAAGIHATYLVDDARLKTARFREAAEFAAEAIQDLPGEANSHYRHAFALGRYSQCISIAKALAEGHAGKVRDALEATLKIAPKHAEAHLAMGVYHAEIVGKVGSMLARLTYGASAAAAEKHLASARELTPGAPIAWVETGNALLRLDADRRGDEAAEAYDHAMRLKPHDAMEALDVAFAREQLA